MFINLGALLKQKPTPRQVKQQRLKHTKELEELIDKLYPKKRKPYYLRSYPPLKVWPIL